MAKNKRILVIRLSALGDVAILEPVLRQRAQQNPEVEFILAAPGLLEPLFSDIPNLEFVATKKDKAWKMWKKLREYKPTMVADVHGVLRTMGIRFLFGLSGIGSKTIDKERGKRKGLLRENNKDMTPLTPSWKRYDKVFDRCGLKGKTVMGDYCERKEAKRIGIAPFAQHRGKIYPLEKMERVVELLSQREGTEVLLFGGKNESEQLAKWEEKYPRVKNMAGKLKFAQELDLIASLDVMISMDSANMHFASCKGVRVVSIWGATHPAAGFYGWRQNEEDAVMLPMECRPCSMFGNKPCKWGDYRCMNDIAPEVIVAKL